jgi:hypothetical protein
VATAITGKISLDFAHGSWVTFATSSIVLYHIIVSYHNEHLGDFVAC